MLQFDFDRVYYRSFAMFFNLLEERKIYMASIHNISYFFLKCI